jgi:hypothetical protein
MREFPVKLDRLGSRIVLNVMRDIWGLPNRRCEILHRSASGDAALGADGGIAIPATQLILRYDIKTYSGLDGLISQWSMPRR